MGLSASSGQLAGLAWREQAVDQVERSLGGIVHVCNHGINNTT